MGFVIFGTHVIVIENSIRHIITMINGVVSLGFACSKPFFQTNFMVVNPEEYASQFLENSNRTESRGWDELLGPIASLPWFTYPSSKVGGIVQSSTNKQTHRETANAFCRSRLQTRIAGASHQIDQRSRSAHNGDSTTQIRQWGLDHTNPGLLRTCKFLAIFLWKRALATVWCTFCRTSSSKSAPNGWFLRFLFEIELSLQVLCAFCRQLS